MATRADVRGDVKSLLGADANLSDAEVNVFITLRYERTYETFGWSRRLRNFTVLTLAQTKSTSTTLATVTQDSPTVTFAGTPITTAMDGAQIQIGAEPGYFFAKRDSSSQVTLQDGEATNVNWPRASGGSQTWRIFKTVYALPSTLDSIWSMVAGDDPMDEVDGGLSTLDATDPNRDDTLENPTHWVLRGVDASDNRRVEIWPVPTAAILLQGQGFRRPPTLADATVIDIPRPLLVYWTAADACNMLHAKTGDESWRQLALYYTREAEGIFREYGPVEMEKLSPPRSLARATGRFTRFRGTDWEASHQFIEL